MVIKNKFFHKKFFVGLISIFFLVLLIFLIANSYSNMNRDLEVYTASEIDMINQRMISLYFEINSFPRDAGDDILFLSKLSNLRDVADSVEGESRTNTIKNLENDFLEFMKGSIAYYQLRYIDKEGNEIVRVDYDGNVHKIIPQDELQNKRDRYYFSETINLDEGDVFISPLDLNIEHGELENRGTKENPEYVSVMRYATPVFSGDGTPKGVVISNIYVDYFLEDIRRFQREGESVFLINSNGYYLAHPDREKEFAFMLGGEDNFYNDYSEISKEVLSDFSKKNFRTDDLIFSFKQIYPTAGNFGIHSGSERIFGDDPEGNYYWVLVSVSEKTGITETLENLKNNYLFFSLFLGIIILINIVLVFIVVFKIPNSKEGERK